IRGGLGSDGHETSARDGGIDQVVHQVLVLADHGGRRIAQTGVHGQFVCGFPLVFNISAENPVTIILGSVGSGILGIGDLPLNLRDGALHESRQTGEGPVATDNERSPRVFALAGCVAARFDAMRAMSPDDIVSISKLVRNQIERQRGAGAKSRKTGESSDRAILSSRSRSEELERMISGTGYGTRRDDASTHGGRSKHVRGFPGPGE